MEDGNGQWEMEQRQLLTLEFSILGNSKWTMILNAPILKNGYHSYKMCLSKTFINGLQLIRNTIIGE